MRRPCGPSVPAPWSRARGRRPAAETGAGAVRLDSRRAHRLASLRRASTSRAARAAWPASRRPCRTARRRPRRVFRPEPTATVICSRDGPLTGDRNSSAGELLPPSMYGWMSLMAAGTRVGQRGPLDHVRAGRGDAGAHRVGALDRADEVHERLGRVELRAGGGLRDVGRGRHPDRRAVGRGVVARLAEEPDVVDRVGEVRRPSSRPRRSASGSGRTCPRPAASGPCRTCPPRSPSGTSPCRSASCRCWKPAWAAGVSA